MGFEGADVAAIEAVLDAQRPGGWRRLSSEVLKTYGSRAPRAGWRLDLPAGYIAHPDIDHLLLMIDVAFPWSEPRVVAPQAKGAFTWPHIEADGLLCLPLTRYELPAADRALACLSEAIALLNFDEATRRREFSREFVAYWNHKLPATHPGPLFLTLTKPEPRTREVFYYRATGASQIVLADDRDSLKQWLRNSGQNPGDKQIEKTLLLWLREPLIPSEYAESGRDIMGHLPDGALSPYLYPGEALPLLLGVTTETGPVFAGVELRSAPEKELLKGFRDWRRVPPINISRSFAGHALVRCRVERADAMWIHGRDHDPAQAALGAKRVAIVGSGSLGAAVARLLAQAGIGRFLLIDADSLAPHNTSRHVLGHRFIRQNKAEATARMLREDFPHLRFADALPHRVETLRESQLEQLSACDLVLSAGIDPAGDSFLDRWRKTRMQPPVHVSTWVEEYALVGHAVSLFGADSLLAGFSPTGVPQFTLTDWPDGVSTVIAQAGCGNVFQPHGIVELSATITLAASLVLDVLLGRVSASCRRVWQGDRNALIVLGGRPRPGFDESNVTKTLPWP